MTTKHKGHSYPSVPKADADDAGKRNTHGGGNHPPLKRPAKKRKWSV